MKELPYKTDKRDLENVLKSLDIDNEYYRRKHKSLNKKEVLFIITEVFMGSASTINSCTLAILYPSVGVILWSFAALLTCISVLITKEHVLKLKNIYTKLKVWIKVITLLHEKIFKQSMIDKKIGEKELLELKEIYDHYLDKRKQLMKKTQFKVEDIFGDILFEDSISPEQITKINIFLAQNLWISFCFSGWVYLHLDRKNYWCPTACSSRI